MRKFGCFLALAFLLCLTASAQDAPKAEAFLGYSYLRANPATSGVPGFNLNGGSGSIALNPWNSLGIVGDFGGYHVGNIGGSGVDANLYTYLFGPRFSYRAHERITPFAQALFGGAHLGGSALGSSGSTNGFAMALGGGVDVNASEHVAFRLGQFEYLLTRFDEGTGNASQHNLRFSTGVVFRFGRR